MRFSSLTPTAQAIAWTLGAVLSFAVVPITVRVASAELSAPETATWRHAIALTMMLPWIFRVGLAGLVTRNMRLHLMRAGFNGTAMMLWFGGLALVPVADAVALQFTLPLFVVVFAVLFLKEVVGPRRIAALLVGFGGTLIIVRPGFADVSPAMIMLLVSAALYAATVVVMRSQSQRENPVLIMFWASLLMGIYSAIPAVIMGWVWPSPAIWPWLVALAAGGWMAQYCLTRALKLADAKVVTALDFLRMPIVAVVAYPLFGEFPDAWTWIGALVIIASATYIAHRDARNARRAAIAEAAIDAEDEDRQGKSAR